MNVVWWIDDFIYIYNDSQWGPKQHLQHLQQTTICKDKSSLWTRPWWIPAHMQLDYGLSCKVHWSAFGVILDQEKHIFSSLKAKYCNLLCFNSLSLIYSDLINTRMGAQTKTSLKTVVHTCAYCLKGKGGLFTETLKINK